MLDVFFRLIIAIISSLMATKIISFVKKDRFLYVTLALIYIIWHIPLFLSIILPFTFPLRNLDNLIIIIFILTLIHLIQFSGVFAYINFSKLNKLYQEQRFIHTRKPTIYFWLSSLAPILIVIDNYVIRKVPLSLELMSNSHIRAESSSTLFTFIGVIGAGCALFLLNWFLDGKQAKVDFKILIFFPYLTISILYFALGTRQYFVTGLMVILLNLIYLTRPKFQSFSFKMTRFLALVIPILLSIQFLRNFSSTEVNDLSSVILSIIKIEFIEGHPLTDILNNGSLLTAILGLLYLYFGVEYDALSATINTVEPSAPFTAYTIPLIYRRFNEILDLPAQDLIRANYHAQIYNQYGIFPRIWTTMFGNFYLEGGVIYIIFIASLLAGLHYLLVKKYVISGKKDNVIYLITFYCVMIRGVMFFSLWDSSFFFYVCANLLKPFNNLFVKTINKMN